MPEQLWLTELLNAAFGPMTTALLRRLGIESAYPAAPITNTVAMELLVVLFLIAFFLAVRATLSVERPGKLQHVAEMAHEFISDQAHSVIGHDYRRYVPYAMAVCLCIMIINLLGLLPGFESPTPSPPVPLGCALVTFAYYHFHEILTHSYHYVKQLLA